MKYRITSLSCSTGSTRALEAKKSSSNLAFSRSVSWSSAAFATALEVEQEGFEVGTEVDGVPR